MSEENPYLADPPNYRDAEWLEEQYHDEGKSLAEIAETQDVSIGVIQYYMEKNGLTRRPAGRDRFPDGVGAKLLDLDWLYDRYWVDRQSAPEIADSLGVHVATVYRALEGAGIERRSQSEAQRLRRKKERDDE